MTGPPLPGGDVLRWVAGGGAVEGPRLRGTLRRFTEGLHRADGVNVPRSTGVIECDDGGVVHYELRGIAPPGVDSGRLIVGAITFRTGSERHAWLNGVFGLVEAAYEEGAPTRYHVYECAPSEDVDT